MGRVKRGHRNSRLGRASWRLRPPFKEEWEYFATLRESGRSPRIFAHAENYLLKSVWAYPRTARICATRTTVSRGPWIDTGAYPQFSPIRRRQMESGGGVRLARLSGCASGGSIVRWSGGNYHAALYDALLGRFCCRPFARVELRRRRCHAVQMIHRCGKRGRFAAGRSVLICAQLINVSRDSSRSQHILRLPSRQIYDYSRNHPPDYFCMADLPVCPVVSGPGSATPLQKGNPATGSYKCSERLQRLICPLCHSEHPEESDPSTKARHPTEHGSSLCSEWNREDILSGLKALLRTFL